MAGKITIRKRGGWFTGVFFFTLFLLFGLGFGYLIGRDIVQEFETYRWKEITCEIIDSQVVVDEKKDTSPYSPAIQYRYTEQGQQQTSARVTRKEEGFTYYDEAYEVVVNYPANSSRPCYVDPKDPSMSILVRRGPWAMLLAMCFPLIFILVGIGGIYGSIVSGRKTSAEEKSGGKTGAVSERGKKNDSAGCLVAFFALFLIVGLVAAYFITIRPGLKIFEAQDWKKTTCQIISSRVVTHSSSSDDGGPTYSVDIFYQYTVGNQQYRSNRYSFITGSSSSYDWKRDVVRRLSPGKTTPCYYNPNQPWRAVINREFHSELLFGLIPLVFILVGAGGLVWIRKGTKTNPRTQTPGVAMLSSAVPSSAMQGTTKFSSASDFEARALEQDGPLELKPAASPLGKFIAIFIFAGIWNGVVFFLAGESLQSFGQGDWFAALFAVPFILVGILLLALAAYFFLGTFNPRPELTLSKLRVALGDQVALDWKFTGKVSRITELVVFLEGREEATYRRGTDTHTDKHTFFRKEIKRTSSAYEIPKGRATVSLPVDTMPSFGANNNKILWYLKIQGVIARWPDVDEEYQIEVVPSKKV